MKHLQEATKKRDGLKQNLDGVTVEKIVAFKALGLALKEINDMERQIRDTAEKIRVEEEKQAKWKDVDQDEQDQGILELLDTSSFDQEEQSLVQQIEVSIHTDKRTYAHTNMYTHSHIHPHVHARACARTHTHTRTQKHSRTRARLQGEFRRP